MYIKRNDHGNIEEISREATADCMESIDPASPELLAFIGHGDGAHLNALRRSDLELVRVLEDVIYLLIDKGKIGITDLPSAAREKLMARRSLRQRGDNIDLLGDAGHGII